MTFFGAAKAPEEYLKEFVFIMVARVPFCGYIAFGKSTSQRIVAGNAPTSGLGDVPNRLILPANSPLTGPWTLNRWAFFVHGSYFGLIGAWFWGLMHIEHFCWSLYCSPLLRSIGPGPDKPVMRMFLSLDLLLPAR